MMENILVELRPKQVVDKLTLPASILCRLILENEVCKKKERTSRSFESTKKVDDTLRVKTYRRPTDASRQRYRARSC